MYIATPFISTVVWSAKLKVASAGEANKRKTSPQVKDMIQEVIPANQIV